MSSIPDKDLWYAGYRTGIGEAFDFLLALPGVSKYERPEATYEVWHRMMANPVARQHYHLLGTKGT